MIIIGNDHGGVELKNEIVEYFQKENIKFIDLGNSNKESSDYPDEALKVINKLKEYEDGKGILICGTGIGISISANRYKGIRCALCHDVFSAKATREHNDSNILALGGRVVGAGLALEIVKAFINTNFLGDERHIRRIEKIDKEM